MTNSPPTTPPICCPSGGADLLPLLLGVAGLLAVNILVRQFKKWKGKPEMKNFKNLVMVTALIVAVGVVLALKRQQSHMPVPGTATMSEPFPSSSLVSEPSARPRLLELGADKCMACRQMAPIIADLRSSYVGQLQVDFIDVWKNPDAAQPYHLRVIPTQIFLSADGAELFRHEGFFPKENILAKWKELGVDLQ